MGEVTIRDYKWVKLFPTLTYGVGNDVELFRVRHDWDGSKDPRGKVWFGSYFESSQTRGLNRALYPYKGDWKVLESPVPLSFIKAGLVDRTLMLKPDSYSA